MLQGRIRPKYRPIPTAREKAFHIWLMCEFECGCGCEAVATVVHHPLTQHPAQRWRRDHEYVVPMNGHCHMALHRRGHERDEPFHNMAERASWYRLQGQEAGKL